MKNYNDLQKAIFDFSYVAALDDAIGQKAFEGNKIILRRNEEAKSIARQYINGILGGKFPDFYKTVEALENSFEKYIDVNKDAVVLRIKNKESANKRLAERQKDKKGNLIEPKFRFGNAQKLINMLAKNMFVLVYQDESLRANFAQCHCPMDNIMIATVKIELNKIIQSDSLDKEVAKKLLGDYRKCETVAWSRIEEEHIEQYKSFQECVDFLAVREGLSPIEYDYWMWKKASLD